MEGAHLIATVGSRIWDGRSDEDHPNETPPAMAWPSSSHGIPKQLLFGELLKKRPSHGTKKRWRDLARDDLKSIDVSEKLWFDIAQDNPRIPLSQGWVDLRSKVCVCVCVCVCLCGGSWLATS